jgi:parallel beta-helix repeat protein
VNGSDALILLDPHGGNTPQLILEKPRILYSAIEVDCENKLLAVWSDDVLPFSSTLSAEEMMLAEILENGSRRDIYCGAYNCSAGLVDINCDGKVNIIDIANVAKAFGTAPGNKNWNLDADLDSNKKINILDVAKVAKEFGGTFSSRIHCRSITVTRNNQTLTVPDDYSTIQKAVDAAKPGDCIVVRNGTYYENVVIEKDNLALTGESKYATVIDGVGKENIAIAVVAASNVTITGFKVQNCAIGILMEDSNGTTVFGNIIRNNTKAGIAVWAQVHHAANENMIVNNILESPTDASGILVFGANESEGWGDSIRNTISNNTVMSGFMGIGLYSTTKNTLIGNIFSKSSARAVLWNSSDNMIFHNAFINNTYQTYIIDSLNTWDDGYPAGGNYWSDYVGPDLCSGFYQNETGSDGIGDTPYSMLIFDYEENTIGMEYDGYPLMQPISIQFMMPGQEAHASLAHAAFASSHQLQSSPLPEIDQWHQIIVDERARS